METVRPRAGGGGSAVIVLLLALMLADASAPAAEARLHAVYISPPNMPALQPEFEKAIADRLKVDFVESKTSNFDRTALFLPTEVLQDVCRDTHVPRVVSANAVISHPTNASSLVLVLSVSVYDCVNHLFITATQSSTGPVPDGNPGMLDTGYREALKILLEQLSPPVVKKRSVSSDRPSYPLDVPTAFPAPAGPPQ